MFRILYDLPLWYSIKYIVTPHFRASLPRKDNGYIRVIDDLKPLVYRCLGAGRMFGVLDNSKKSLRERFQGSPKRMLV